MNVTTKGFIGAAIIGLSAVSIVSAVNKQETTQITALAERTPPKPATSNFKAPETGRNITFADMTIKEVVLSEANTVVFRSEVNAFSVGKAQRELLRKSRSLPRAEPLYLVLDTPGGDIVSGNQLIDTAKGLGREVHTITIFAASMGFNIVQRLNNRYILPSGTLMAHRATVSGIEGQVPGEAVTALATTLKVVTRMEEQNAGRLGITFDDYTRLVKDEYWVDGEDSLRQGAADNLVSIKCDKTLQGEVKETFQTFFGKVTIVWDKCPAVTAPVGLEFGGNLEDFKRIKESSKNFRSFRKLLSQAPGSR